jgi:hypothetical protein
LRSAPDVAIAPSSMQMPPLSVWEHVLSVGWMWN